MCMGLADRCQSLPLPLSSTATTTTTHLIQPLTNPSPTPHSSLLMTDLTDLMTWVWLETVTRRVRSLGGGWAIP
jgi:hypothetical protein